MGIYSSKETKNKLQYYSITPRGYTHTLFGDFDLAKDQLSGKTFLRQQITVNLTELQKNQIAKRLEFSHPHIIGVQSYEKISDDQYSIFYEQFNRTLRQEIEGRSITNTRFTETELFTLLRNIISALAYFQENNCPHTLVRPDTIISFGSAFKIIDPILVGFFQDNLDIARSTKSPEDKRLLSNELSAGLRDGNVKPHDKFKDDVYAFGVLFVDAASLNLDPNISVREKIETSTYYYSKSFISIVNKMTESVTFLRPDPIALYHIIDDIVSNGNDTSQLSASRVLPDLSSYSKISEPYSPVRKILFPFNDL